MDKSDILYRISLCYEGRPDENYPDTLPLYQMLDDPNSLRYDRPVLFFAAANGDAAAVKYLLEAGADPTALYESMENTALHHIAYEHRSCMSLKPGAIREVTLALLEAGTSALKKNADSRTCTFVAAETACFELIAALIEKGKKLDIPGPNGDTPLHAACTYACHTADSFFTYTKKQYDEIMAAPAATNDTDARILQMRRESQQQQYDRDKGRVDAYFETVRLLLEGGLDPEQKNNYGETAKEIAFKCKDLRIAALLAGIYRESDASKEEMLQMRTKGMNAVQAVIYKDYDALEAILTLGEDPNSLYDGEESIDSIRPNGMVPLGVACSILDAKSIQLLCEHGADVNLKDTKGNSPAAYLAAAGSYVRNNTFTEMVPETIFDTLKKQGLRVDDVVNEKGATLLMLICDRLDGSYSHNTLPGRLVRILLRNGADANLADNEGTTPLMRICAGRSSDMEDAQLTLLEHGADVSLQDKHGNTALMFAAQNSNLAMAKVLAEMLFEFGDPKPDAVNNNGKTALDFAAEADNELLLNYLLAKQ